MTDVSNIAVRPSTLSQTNSRTSDTESVLVLPIDGTSAVVLHATAAVVGAMVRILLVVVMGL